MIAECRSNCFVHGKNGSLHICSRYSLFSNFDYDISVFMMSTSISVISGIIDSSSEHYLLGPVARGFVWRVKLYVYDLV